MHFRSFMDIALSEARLSAKLGEVPIGAVVASPTGQILAQAGNQTRRLHDPTAHAEILAIREACQLVQNERLSGCSLYVTLEPCAMCAATISAARIARLYYGAADPKSGGVENGAKVFTHSQCHHKPEIYSGLAEESAEHILKSFFASKRIS